MLKIIGRILAISGKYKGKLIFSFVMSFLENMMASLSIFSVYFALDWVVSGTVTRQKNIILAAFLLGTLILRFAFKLLEYIFQSGVGYEVVSDERLKLGEKLLHLSMGFYSDTDAGNISSVLNNDLVFVENMAMNFLSKVIGGIISGVIITAFMFSLDPQIALIACAGYPAAWLLNKRIQKLYVKFATIRQETHAGTASVMLEYLQGIYVIKAFNLAGKQGTRLESVLKRLEVVSCDFEMKVLPWMNLYLCCFHICTTLILGAVAVFYLGASITLSTAFLFVVMLFTFYAPMEITGLSSGVIRLMNACLDRMQSIMDYPVMDSDSQDIQPSKHDVAFRDVSFAYGEKQVLNGITFHAPEHTMTAIVGPSGSGKSTLLNLIARFWDVNAGSIEIGGIDVRNMKCGSVMDCISAVFQKAYLFHDTIFNNIHFGNPGATRQEVMESAKKAHCHEFIMKLESGYETEIGEAGSTLSGGERQRIAIARALLKNAPIVLLDEVTANIDPENEMLIQQAINELVREKTVFIVAHKLATIQNANQIIVMGDNGQIRETGRHDELLNRQGLYADLWRKSQKISSWSIAG